MRVTEIRYTRRWNLGDFNSEDVGATATLEEYDDVNTCFTQLKDIVAAQHVDAPKATTPAAKPTPTKPLALAKPAVVAVPPKPVSAQAQRITNLVKAAPQKVPLIPPEKTL